MNKLEKRTAIVTGAAQGFGKAIAERYVAEGAKVLLADCNETGVKHTAEALGQPWIVADVSQRGNIVAMVDRALELWDGLDILVNNAGIFAAIPFLEITEEQFDRFMAVNLKSMFLASQAVAPHMIARGRGAIVNLASIGAVLGSANGIPYCVSKAGVVQLTVSTSLALAPHGVRVNAIGPGTIDTEMAQAILASAETQRQVLSRTPMGRIGRADEIASVAAFLASEDSSYITGQTIYVDGGRKGLNGVMPPR